MELISDTEYTHAEAKRKQKIAEQSKQAIHLAKVRQNSLVLKL